MDGGGVDIAIPVIFGLSVVFVSVGVYKTCSINPCDVNLLPVNDPRRQSAIAVPKQESPDIYCYVCEKAVSNTSKHCKFCRKCITAFDHHCKWLNTCVGAANYRYFLTAVFGISLTTTVSLALSLAYLVESWVYPDRIEMRGEEGFVAVTLLSTRIVSIISTVLLLPLVAMVYQLAGFHIMLLCKGLTTYDYIVLENKKQKARREKAAVDMKAKRDELRAKSMAAFGNAAFSRLDKNKHDNAVKSHLKSGGLYPVQPNQEATGKNTVEEGVTDGPDGNVRKWATGGTEDEGVEMQARSAPTRAPHAIASPDSPPPTPGVTIEIHPPVAGETV